jgi:hypothetical protein
MIGLIKHFFIFCHFYRFLTLYIHTLHISVALRVWDTIFALSDEGDNACCAVLACGIAILESVKDSILHPNMEKTCGNVVEIIASFKLCGDDSREYFLQSFNLHMEALPPKVLRDIKNTVLKDARHSQLEQFVSGVRSLRLCDREVTEKLIADFHKVLLSSRATSSEDAVEISYSEEAILTLSRISSGESGQSRQDEFMVMNDIPTLQVVVWRRDDFSSCPHSSTKIDLQSTEFRVVNHEIHIIDDKSVVMYLVKGHIPPIQLQIVRSR